MCPWTGASGLSSDLMKLYNYFRSSASYRVRIALALKGIAYEYVPVHIARGDHRLPAFTDKAVEGLVPLLELDDGTRLTQSMAIIEYLDELQPAPALLPADALGRARVRALAQIVACEIHPLNNLRVLQYFDGTWNVPQSERDEWVKHWIIEGFAAVESLLAEDSATGAYCHGQTPGLADCCLVPQVFNARRFGVDMAAFPTIVRIEQACLALPAFDQARPESQPDANA